jgi:2,4-dienoyl-CoA reductase-like NADH-dependent reductase (Old Yellow Enzyme family)
LGKGYIEHLPKKTKKGEKPMSAQGKSAVFSPGRIGLLEIKNRLVRSATYDNAATDKGEVSDFMINLYRNLAKGGVGLIITGAAGVYSRALKPDFIMRADDDSCIPSLGKIPRTVREAAPDCKVILQLHHPGRQIINREDTVKFIPVLPPAFIAYITKHPELVAPRESAPHTVEPTAPSSIHDTFFDRTPRELTTDDIDEIIEAYAEGIHRAQKACFDGVQLHAAHGYLLSSFLSPQTNRREDQYGGSTENRTRIVREIYLRARKKVGDLFPILIKINTTDLLPGGIDIDEFLRVGSVLFDTGFTAIETSGGMWESLTRKEKELGWKPVFMEEARTGIKDKDQEAYFLPGAKALKEKTKATIILVGGLRSLSRIEELVGSGSVDFVSLSRPLIRQPDLPNIWYSGSGPDKAECVSCNACLPVGNAPICCRAKKE